MKNNQTSPPEA